MDNYITMRQIVLDTPVKNDLVIVQAEEINFHAGDEDMNLHAGQDINFHAGQGIDPKTTKVDSRECYAGHDGNIHSANFHAGNFHAGDATKGNFHAGSFYAGNDESNFHAGQQCNFHAGHQGNFHAGNFHAGQETNNFHVGDDNTNFHAGQDSANSHDGNFHAGKESGNFHRGNFHAGNFHAGNFHAGSGTTQNDNLHSDNFHAGQRSNNFHAGHLGNNFHSGNFHAGATVLPPDLSPKETVVPPNGSTSAQLVFYVPPKDGSKPYNYVEQPTNGGPHMNFGGVAHNIQITDIRGEETRFDMDSCSFGTVKGLLPVNPDVLASNEDIKAVLYPEVEKAVMRNCPGSPQRVLIFDHTIRRPGSGRAPVNRTHIDQSPESALARVQRHLHPSDAEALLAGRVRLINFWRPINGTVFTNPLAFADSQSVRDEDLVVVDHVYPTWKGETLGVKYHEGQKWYYWSGMKEDEALLLQCFDSEHGGRLAHTAFNDSRTEKGWKIRESIEVRALVFG